MKRTSFLGVSFTRTFIEPFNFSFFSITGWGTNLDYCGIEWFALEMNRDHSVIFEIASKYCILDSCVYHEGYSISSKGFLPTVVDIMVIWIKFAHSPSILGISQVVKNSLANSGDVRDSSLIPGSGRSPRGGNGNQSSIVKCESEVTQSCPTLSDPMACSLPGSSAHGIFQARLLLFNLYF